MYQPRRRDKTRDICSGGSLAGLGNKGKLIGTVVGTAAPLLTSAFTYSRPKGIRVGAREKQDGGARTLAKLAWLARGWVLWLAKGANG